MMRLTSNTNLFVTNEPTYKGYPVQYKYAPLIADYLDRIIYVTELSLQDYSKVFAFRFDLHFPEYMILNHEPNWYLQKFLKSLKAIIKHDRRDNQHKTSVRYVWVKEYGEYSNKPHYHLAILLNGNAYRALGSYDIYADNLYSRLVDAWSRAIGKLMIETTGLVHIPDNAQYLLSRMNREDTKGFVFRLSYMAKAKTKRYGFRVEGYSFGSSRW